MSTFGTLANNIKKLDLNKIYQDVFSLSNIQKWMIEANQKRLYNTGLDSDGNKIETDNSKNFAYSDWTMSIKAFKGQKNSNVTLKDSGEFYDSMKINLNLYGFETDANFEKRNGNMYKNFTKSYSGRKDFASKMIGLTDQDLNEVIKMAAPLIAKSIYEAI